MKIQYFLPECGKQDDLRIPNRIIYMSKNICFFISTDIKSVKTVPILWKYGKECDDMQKKVLETN